MVDRAARRQLPRAHNAELAKAWGPIAQDRADREGQVPSQPACFVSFRRGHLHLGLRPTDMGGVAARLASTPP